MRLRKLLSAILGLLLLAGSAPALQITFPVETGSGAGERSLVLRARSLKERFGRFDVTYSGDFYRFGTYGDRSRAFRPDATYTINNLGIFLASKMENGLDYEVKLSTRSVNDPAVSFRDDLHFTAFYALLGRKDVWNLRGGDLFPNYSRYTINRFVKGVQGNYFRLNGPIKWSLGGVMARSERAREAATLRRVALATALTAESIELVRARPKWRFGYRFASASDQMGSVDSVRALADLQADVHSVVYGGELPGGWSVSAENAWSDGSTNRRLLRDRRGYAWSTDASWLRPSSAKPYAGMARLLPFAAQFNWELVDPYFQAPLGVAAPNLLKWNIRTAHRFNENFDWSANFLRTEDNVRNQGVNTNVTRTTTLTANMRPFLLFGTPSWTDALDPSIRAIRTKVEFRYNDRDATNGTVNNRLEEYNYTMLYSNYGINFVGDYQFQITDDDAAPRSDRRLQAYGIKATRPLHWKKYEIRFFPTMGYRVSRDHFRITGSSTYLQTTTLGMGATWEELGANLNYQIIDADRAPGGSDYLQNKLGASITYKPYLYPGFQGTISYGYTDVDDETVRRSYRQTETRLTMSYAF